MNINFRATGNVSSLTASLARVQRAANATMSGVWTGATNVQAPINDLNKKIRSGSLGFKDWGNAIRQSSKIIEENNALIKSNAVSLIDAAGNAKVYQHIVRGSSANMATFSQRIAYTATVTRALGSQMIKTGKNIQWAGRQVMVGFTFPLLALSAAATKVAEDFDREMTRVVKVTDLSQVGVRDSFGAIVRTFELGTESMSAAISSIERQVNRLADVGASMGFLATDTARVAAEFSQMGFAGFALDGLTESALRLSRVSGADLTDSINLARLGAMTFGKELGEGPNSLIETFARLNLIENSTSLSLAEMAGAIPIVASVAKNLSIEVEELGGLLALMKDKGIDAREGATSLRTGLIRLVQDATDPSIAAFSKLNMNIVELQEMNRGSVMGMIVDLANKLHQVKNSGEGAAQQTELFIAAIGKMVGTRAAARFTSMLEGMEGNLEKFTDENGVMQIRFKEINGTIDTTTDAYRALAPAIEENNTAMKQFAFEEERVNKSLAGQAEILRAQINREMETLGRLMLPIKNMLVELAVSALRWVNSLDEGTRKMVGGIVGLLAVLGPATMTFGVFSNMLGQVIKVMMFLIPRFKLTTLAQQAQAKAFSATTVQINTANTAASQFSATQAIVASAVNNTTSAINAQTAALAGNASATRSTFMPPPSKGRGGVHTGRPLPGGGRNLSMRMFGAGPVFDRLQSQLQLAQEGGPLSMGAYAMSKKMKVRGLSRKNQFRAMLSNEKILEALGPEADVDVLTRREGGVPSHIQMIRHHLAEQMARDYEQHVIESRKGPIVPGTGKPKGPLTPLAFAMQNLTQQYAQRAGVSAGRSGLGNIPGRPEELRAAMGLPAMIRGSDVIYLNKDTRRMIRSSYGVPVGGRARVDEILSAVPADQREGLREYLERSQMTGGTRRRERYRTESDIIGEDIRRIKREVDVKAKAGDIPDTPAAREALEREMMARAAKERPSRLSRAVGSFTGKGAPQTAFEHGIVGGRNLVLKTLKNTIVGPFKIVGKSFSLGIRTVKLFTKSLMSPIKTFKAMQKYGGQAVKAIRLISSALGTPFINVMNRMAVRASNKAAEISGRVMERAGSIRQRISEMGSRGMGVSRRLRGRMAGIGIPTSVGGFARRARDVVMRRQTAGRAGTRQMDALRMALGGAPGPSKRVSMAFKTLSDTAERAVKSVKALSAASMASSRSLLRNVATGASGKASAIMRRMRGAMPAEGMGRIGSFMRIAARGGGLGGFGYRMNDNLPPGLAYGLRPSMLSRASSALYRAPGAAMRGISGVASGGISGLSSSIVSAMNSAKNGISSAASAFSKSVKSVPSVINRMSKASAAAAASLMNLSRSTATAARGMISRIAGAAVPKIASAGDMVKKSLTSMGEQLKKIANSMKSATLAVVALGKAAWVSARDLASTALAGARGSAGRAWDFAKRSGRAVGRGITSLPSIPGRFVRSVRGSAAAGQLLNDFPIIGRMKRGAAARAAQWGGSTRAADYTRYNPVRAYRNEMKMRQRNQMRGPGGKYQTLPQNMRNMRSMRTAALKRAAVAGLGGLKTGGLSLAGGAVGAVGAISIPIILTLGAAAIANPEQFKKKLMEMFSGPVAFIKKMWDDLTGAVNRLVFMIKSAGDRGKNFGQTLSSIFGGLIGYIGGALTVLLGTVMSLVTGIVELFTALMMLFQGDFSGALELVKNAFKGIFLSIAEGFITLLDMIAKVPGLGKAAKAVKGMIEGWAVAQRESLEEYRAIGNAMASVARQQSQLNDMSESITEQQAETKEIIDDLIRFRIIEQDQVDNLVDMAALRNEYEADANLSYEERTALMQENMERVYDEIIGMEQITDEQKTQLALYVRREGIQARIEKARADLEMVQNALALARGEAEVSINDARLTGLAIAMDQAKVDEAMAAGDYDRALALARAGHSRNRNAIDRNRLAGLEYDLQQRLNVLNEELLGVENEINKELQGRVQRRDLERSIAEAAREEMEQDIEDAKEAMEALKSATQEVMADIQKALGEIVSDQADMISQFFDSLNEASDEYFSSYYDQLDDQTDKIMDAIDQRADAESEAINKVADERIEVIQEQMKKEEELDAARQRIFEKERARIEYLKNRRIASINIQEALLRGEIGEAGILEIERRAQAELYFASLVESRNDDLVQSRIKAQEAVIEAIDKERESALEANNERLQLSRMLVEDARARAREMAEIAEERAQKEIEFAIEAAEKAREAEEQRIENYLREWEAVTPATEEEFLQHTAKLEKFLTDSGIRLKNEINEINRNLNTALGEISSDFQTENNSIISTLISNIGAVETQYTSTANSIIADIASASVNVNSTISEVLAGIGQVGATTEMSLGEARNRFESSINGMLSDLKIGSDETFSYIINQKIPEFTSGLSTGFVSAEALQREFLSTFESQLVNGFETARNRAAAAMAESAKWQQVGNDIAREIERGYNINPPDIGGNPGPGDTSAPGPGPGGGGSFPGNPGADKSSLRRGNADPVVTKFLQRRLNEFWNQRLTVDGIFGPATEAAVVRVQQALKKAANGIVDSSLYSIIMSQSNRSVPNSSTGGRPVMHSGGLVGDRMKKSGEVSAILENGEYVIQKSAVARLGTDFLDRINAANARFVRPEVASIAIRKQPMSNQSNTTNNYELSFNIDGGNIDENALAKKVVFEIKRMERDMGMGRRSV